MWEGAYECGDRVGGPTTVERGIPLKYHSGYLRRWQVSPVPLLHESFLPGFSTGPLEISQTVIKKKRLNLLSLS